MSSPADRFATPRVAAGALFVADGRVFLVRKTYGNKWDIPGGYVDIGESPATACRREVQEELGLAREPQRLLAVDWAPNGNEGDKILYIFDCGQLGDEREVTLDGDELDKWEWVPAENLGDYVIPRLARRLTHAYEAYSDKAPAYLEHGEPAIGA